MALQNLDTGTSANSNDGDTLRAAFVKVKAMFTEMYGSLGNGSALSLTVDDNSNVNFTGTLTTSDSFGVGITIPEALVHVVKDGTVPASISENYQIATNSNTNGGINVVSGANSSGSLSFGDSDNYEAGSISYANDNHTMSLSTNSSTVVSIDSLGAIQFNEYGAGLLKTDASGNVTATKFVDEADGIINNDNDTTVPTSAAVVDYVATEVKDKRQNSYKVIGLAMDYMSRVHDDGGTVEGMEQVMINTEKLILS